MFPLPLRVRIAPGADLTANPATWTWTDITSYVRPRISISRGRPDESGQVPPGSCRLRGNNAGGRFVARNPMGPWYPLLRRNTPLRVEVQVSGVWHIRFTGHINELPVTFVPGSTDTYVDLVASGITRRLGQGSAPVVSTPVRYIPTTSPVAYWPLEDGQLVSEGAALVGGQPMRPFIGAHPAGNVITAVRWGRGELAPWLPGAVSRSGTAGLTAIWAPVYMTPTPSRWTVDFMHRSGTDAGDATVDVNPSYLPGGGLGWPQLYLEPSTQNVLVAMNGEPEVSSSSPTALFDGHPHHVRWDVVQSGAKVAWTVHVDGVLVNSGITSGNMTLRSMVALSFTASAQGAADMVQGHIAVWSTTNSLPDAVTAAFGYAGESAAARMVRLCAENGTPFVASGAGGEAMGPQGAAPLLTLLREAEETDGGVLYELTDGRLGYLRREDRYDRPVDLALTYGQLASPFQPTDDDRYVRNDVTATRPGGTSAQAVDQEHISAEGRYDHQVAVNTLTDEVLKHHAGWRVHLGTTDELRFPQLTLNLRNPRVTSGVVAAWLDSDIGSRMTVANPPPELSLTRIDQVIEGYSESLDRVEWSAVLNCSPASPWAVATVDGDPRAPADGSTLVTALSAAGTSLTVDSTPSNGPWTQDAADFPLAMQVGGEQVTASAINELLDDSFTRSVASGWGTADTGQVWTVDGSAAQYSVVTDLAVHRVAALGTAYRSRTTGLALADVDLLLAVRLDLSPTGLYIRTEPAVRWVSASNYYALRVHVQTTGAVDLQIVRVAGGVEVPLAATTSGVSFVPGALLWMRLSARGALLQGRVWHEGTSEPGWQVVAGDSTHAAGDIAVTTLFPPGNTNALPYNVIYDSVTTLNPQRVTLSARGVSGVQRAWPVGTPVDVSVPAISPL